MPWIKEENCKGCMLCTTVCPVNAISQTDNGTAVIDQETCIRCGECLMICPRAAIRPNTENPDLQGESTVEAETSESASAGGNNDNGLQMGPAHEGLPPGRGAGRKAAKRKGARLRRKAGGRRNRRNR